MAQSSNSLHENPEVLKPQTIDRHRAIVSLMEELEAIDWYDQRVDAASDRALAAVLAHNRDEEKEHAVMTLEWLRRHDSELDRHLRTYLFSETPIVGIEEEAAPAGAAGEDGARAAAAAGTLGIGSLRAGPNR